MYSNDSIYVAFTEGHRHWWTMFLHPTINHCYLVKPDAGRWIIYGKACKAIDLHTIKDINAIIDDSLIVKANSKGAGRSIFMLNTCVGQVKQYLGINKPFILTPYQLLNHLRLKP